MGAKMVQTKNNLESILRVNHAGEHGACQIYRGQMAVLGKEDLDLVHMAEQEKNHLKQFTKLMVEHKIRPTLFQPLWHILGFALGTGTALLGKKYAHACTIAVEEVINDHYENQLQEIDDIDIKNLIKKCQQEEIEHRDLAINQGGEEVKGYNIVSKAIKAASCLAITISKRI